jgi:hypothetical protein
VCGVIRVGAPTTYAETRDEIGSRFDNSAPELFRLPRKQRALSSQVMVLA